MADTENDLLAAAIGNTENEIFNEAVGKDPQTELGEPVDRSVEEMGGGLEGQNEPGETEGEADGTEGEVAEGTEGEGGEGVDLERDPKTGQFVAKPEGEPQKTQQTEPGKPKHNVPISELMNERKTRQGLETQLKAEKDARDADRKAAQDEMGRMNARLDALITGRPQPNQQQTLQQPVSPAKKDIFEDPEGFVADLRKDIEQDVTKRFVAADISRAHEEHGDKFEKAYQAITEQAKSDPAVRLVIQQAWNSMAPARAIMKWHEKQEAIKTYEGLGDPAKLRETIEAEMRDRLAKDPEYRKSILGDAQPAPGTQTGGDAPRTITRLPKSLNGAAGGQSAPSGGGKFSGDDSERGVFEDAFR